MSMKDLMKQAQEMQQKLQDAQKSLLDLTVIGEAGAGAVRVHMKGNHDVTKVEIDEDLLEDEKDMLEDIIASAINDAVRKVERASRDQMQKLTAGMQLPDGMSMPGTGSDDSSDQ